MVVLLIISWAYFSGKIRKILPRKILGVRESIFHVWSIYIVLRFDAICFGFEASACFVAPVFVRLFAAVLLGEKIDSGALVVYGLIGVLVDSARL